MTSLKEVRKLELPFKLAVLIKDIKMDSDSSKKNIQEIIVEDDLPDPSNILQPTWIRRLIRFGDETDRFVSNNRYYLLFHFGILFWIVLFNKSK